MTHIIDTLIEERATRLMRHPALWSFLRRGLDPLLLYDTARAMADIIAPMSGDDAMEYLRATLAMDVEATGLLNIPRTGSAVVTPNHPAGIADGIAVYEALKRVRMDITFLANRDAIRICPGFADMIVPVEWRDGARTMAKTRETLREAQRAFDQQRLVVIFPSGRLARPTPLGLWERPWQATAFALAIKRGVPIVPMHVDGHNSLLYYLAWFVNREIKDMTLFREIINKRGGKYRIDVGEPFEPSGEPAELAKTLRRFVVYGMRQGLRRFPGVDAPPAAAGIPLLVPFYRSSR
ncbi:MAG: 1-acyl-sn-glycerol-3-phosphate acyltransferase [Gammaproteobacteria bacterium]|nr:1-acyl-sn-glycerol-3-phosphate acyltransferase [Gammaproteobacteria bacterium]